ncbi:MAG: GGDEF domain-containing protein, partial [Alphaproteobacteria bacterium]
VELFDRLHHLTTIDPLTSLLNRRAFTETTLPELREAIVHDEPITLVVCDIDHFKLVNDGHGHATGDATLKMFANALRDTCRENDL